MGRSLLKASASSSSEEDKLTYQADLVSDTNPKLTKSFYFSIEGNIVPKPVTNCDFLVLSSGFYAMRHGHDLFIEGTVSTDLLANIEEFQAVWTTWLPKTYTPIQISAQHEMIGDAPTERNAVAACSGGVDATFSMIQHATGRAGRRNCNLAAAVNKSRHHPTRRQPTSHSGLGRRHGLIRGAGGCTWIATEFHHNPDDCRQHEGDPVLG